MDAHKLLKPMLDRNAEEFLRRYAEGERKFHGINLCGADLSGANLCGADLSSAHLGSVNLSGANLCGANLCNANLCGANLCNANLSKVNLLSTYLCHANLFWTVLCGSKIDKTTEIDSKWRLVWEIIHQKASKRNLSCTDLSYAYLMNADLSYANLHKANLCSANLSGANLSGADLNEANLSAANLGSANLSDALLFFTDLSGANLKMANLSRANLDRTELGQKNQIENCTSHSNKFSDKNIAYLNEVNLSNAKVYKVNMQKINLEGANLSNSFLFKVDFKQANLKKVNLIDATLWETQLDGANLNEANLAETLLRRVSLCNADLSYANLTGTDFTDTEINKAIIDGIVLNHPLSSKVYRVNWINSMRLLQTEFIQRLNSNHLLVCPTERLHSELTIVSGEKRQVVRNFCWKMVAKYRNEEPKQIFLNTMKGKLGEEAIKNCLGNLVTSVNYDLLPGGDGKVDFRLTSNYNVGVQVKAVHSNIDTARWSISAEEIEQNVALACILIREEITDDQSEFNLILAGFLPTSMIDVRGNKVSVGINQLLYGGGLRSYLATLDSYWF